MSQLKDHKLFLVYIILFTFAALVFKTTIIKASEEEIAVENVTVEQVYKLEINNSPDFTSIKNEVLSNDVKYVAHPEKLDYDVVLSEIIEGDIDYSSKSVQEINFTVQRYADSKTEKTKIDTVQALVKVQFIDTTAPKITVTFKDVNITEGSKFNPNDYLKDVSDNSFEKVSVEIDDNVNPDKPGAYTVTYTATDVSNNKSSETISVKVKEKPKPKPVVNRVTTIRSGSNDVYGALSIINSYRSASGLSPLKMAGANEMAAAALRAREAANYVSHYRPDGRNYKTAFTDRGLYHSNVIEILTYSGSSAADKVNWWMNSYAHRSALMSPGATHIALGVSGGMWAGLTYR